MSNASLKEQLQAFADRLPEPAKPETKSAEKRSKPVAQHAAKSAPNRQTRQPRSEKPKWLEHAQYGVELLRAYFPACFKSGDAISPLKVGIKQDLLKRLSTLEAIVTEDKACMVKSLSYYVNTLSYHKCVVAGAVRLDLDGKPDGVVTAEEAKYSVERSQAKTKTKTTTAVS